MILAFLGYDPFPNPAKFSEQLAALRRTRGWTIKEAARKLGVDGGTWGKVGANRRDALAAVSAEGGGVYRRVQSTPPWD